MPPPTTRIRVDLAACGYDVAVGAGLLSTLGDTVRLTTGAAFGARAFLAFDRGLPADTVARAEASLAAAGFKPLRHTLSAAEPDKSIAHTTEMLAAMTAAAMDRLEPVVALGGGIIGDLAGFAAAIYRRGVPIVQCPTTLLAMVDASVGGKTGVNLATDDGDLHKNMVGAFHQPRAVIADVEVLRSLPDRFFCAGLAECIKHAMIAADWGDPGLLDWTASAQPRIAAHDPATLIELVSRNARIKAAVVGRDEREQDQSGGRALLNLGHTFAHAIEPLPGLSPDGNPAHAPLQHGEAVALGLVAAARCSVALGKCPADLADRTVAVLSGFGLPTKVRGLPPADQILARMHHDKKVLAGRLRLVLPTAPGRATVVADPPQAAVIAGIDAIRA
jgi:3-dehydroquinate synthase